ncbi:putative regulator of Ras-like GTPase activity (Roadblock/LC7/MglB family) [Streptomyces aurantiacus]|uniref:roadblock/LC7 domain-containing protein n=1 Tax=Streptomyces aurantiacus TaxID=47760 RepID=UPI0027930FE0|nr:roadblock/LC7 domain-containing protein [Streptomyces aurantiacus]MDQ0773010.1 putative regulator of Ras-like GTPase activity (Roadblock/LC7/MglB family) [Streptomyces aurantiacus]
MTTDTPSTDMGLDWLLSNLVDTVPLASGAAVASSDGLLKHFYGMDRDDADRLGAVATGAFSLCGNVSKFFPDAGDATGIQVLLETTVGLLFATRVGDNSVLAVLGQRGVDVGQVGYEMRMLAKRAAPILATPVRPATVG